MTNNLTNWPYQTLGAAHRPPVLFLHGFMGAGTDWLPIAERCAQDFFCLLPDLPGHGRNIPSSPSQPLDFDTVAAGLETFLAQHQLNPVSLIGYSLGGRIALYAATKFPQKIKALVLESCHAGLTDPQARQRRAEADERQAEILVAHGLDAFVEQWYQMDLFKTLQNQPQLLAEIKQKRKKNNPVWLAKAITALSPGRQPPLWQKLDALPMPVLLIAGEFDKKYTELTAKMGQHIPQARLEIIPGAGHNAHLEQPAQVAQVIGQFLRPE